MAEIVIIPAFFVTVGFVVWTIASNWQRHRHLKEMAAFHARVIDRIGSIKDFSEFLQTPGGLRFMNAITADKGPTGPRERILRAVQSGIVLAFVGGGCLLLADSFQNEASDVFGAAGVILISLGIGFLVAAVASYSLGKRLGVLEPANLDVDPHVSTR
jgi:peptidoglycan/LPS O-acetylase OafA/YrhL